MYRYRATLARPLPTTTLHKLPPAAAWLVHLDGHLLERGHWQGKDLQNSKIGCYLKKKKATNQVTRDHQYQNVGPEVRPYASHLSNTALTGALRIASGVGMYTGPGHDLVWKVQWEGMVWMLGIKAHRNLQKRMSCPHRHQEPDRPS